MASRLREPFGKAGLIVAVVALIAALGGSAIAASSATDSKRNNRKGNAGAALAKKYAKTFSLRYSKAFAKRFASAGPAGPQGPVGPAGPKGDNGANGQDGSNGSNGSNGTNGADGNTVLSGVGLPTAGMGVDGDFYIDTALQEIYGPKTTGEPNNGWGFPTSLQGAEGDDGEDGSPWVAGTAPAGALLKGTWAIQQEYTAAAANEVIPVALSTGVPIPAGGMSILVMPAGAAANPSHPLGCTGSTSDPKVEMPTLPPSIAAIACVYPDAASVNLAAPATSQILAGSTGKGGGGVVPLKSAGAGAVSGYGTWAIQVNPAL